MSLLKLAKRILSHIIVVLIGGLFVLSAYTKLFPVEYFETILVKYNIITWDLSKYLARILIAMEFTLGILLLAHVQVKKMLKISFGVVLLFTFFLLFQLILSGNDDNCGCFGALIEFSITESIIKNLITLALIFAVVKWGAFKSWAAPKWLIWTGAVAILITVNIINPPIDIYAGEYIAADYKIDITENENFPERWKKGEKLFLFFSASCGHCKEAAFRISVKYPPKEHKENILVVFSERNKEERIQQFMKEQGIEELDYVTIENSDFLNYTHYGFPKMALMNDGVSKNIYRKYDFFRTKFIFGKE